MKKIRLVSTIKGKILLYTGSMAVVTLSILIFLQNHDMYLSLLEDNQEGILMSNAKAAEEIDKANLHCVTWPKSMALAQANGLFGQRDQSLAFTQAVAAANPNFYEAYLVYEPNADGQDVNYRGQRGADTTGRLNAVFTNVNGKQELVHAVNMETSLYYQGCKDKFLSGASDPTMITEPYPYEGVLMVEQTYPIVVKGRFAGIAGVDRTLGFLMDDLRRIKPYQTADFILVSRLGAIIAATMDSELNTRKIDDTPYREILRFFLDNRTDKIIRAEKDPLDGKEYYYTGCPIKTGEWMLVLRVSSEEILAPIHKTLTRSVAVAILGLILTVMGLVLIGNSITRPLKVTVAAAERIASGDLTQRVTLDAGGEVGQLIDVMGSMTQSLNSLVGHVQSACLQVDAASQQINQAAMALHATVGEQAASAGHTRVASEEIVATADRLVHTMQEVGGMAAMTTTLAEEGRMSLGGMESTMRGLADGTQDIALKLSAIRTKTGKIGKILTAITRIADQTNLLSVNAAIEAEKAGDAGQGFAVVAREIRLLADQTAESAQDIERMVNDMQGAVSAGVSGMEAFSVSVGNALDGVMQLSGQMTQILTQITQLVPHFTAVSDGMLTQSEAARQIRSLVGGLSETARDTAEAATGLNEAAESLQASIRALSSDVSRFKLS